MSANSLRARWSSLSLAASWTYPSDWENPAVDALCEAIANDQDAFAAAERLGRMRAAAGVTLGETLADIDQLIPLIDPKYTEVLRRAVSLGWADRIVGPGSEISDPLTGLVCKDYLMLRLGEIYQECAARGDDVGEKYALVIARVDLSGRDVWQRALPMILVGESLRAVFDAGETLARAGEPMAVVLVRRTVALPRRVQLVSRLIASRLAADPTAKMTAPRVWIEPLPSSYQAARALVTELGR